MSYLQGSVHIYRGHNYQCHVYRDNAYKGHIYRGHVYWGRIYRDYNYRDIFTGIVNTVVIVIGTMLTWGHNYSGKVTEIVFYTPTFSSSLSFIVVWHNTS